MLFDKTMRPRATLSALCVPLAAVVLATACAGLPRKQTPRLCCGVAAPKGFPNTVRSVDESQRTFELRSAQFLERLHTAAGSGPINILALSGGGAGGAFGAGALVGLSRLGKRPEYQIVTGVSVGALIAPFAFLGPAWDTQLTEAFSGAATEHLLQSHWMPWMRYLFGVSFYRGEPLADLVGKYATDEMLQAIAVEATKGRLLLVATTDLDSEQTVIWNLSAIAAQGGNGARQLFRDVLVASASIPGLFPPVIIHVEESGASFDEMHVDGATTASLFIAPEIANVLPEAIAGLRGANVYVLVNGQFEGAPLTTPMKTVPILTRSYDATLLSSSRAAVEIALSLSLRVGMNFSVADIPNDYPYGGPLDLQPSKMKALFEFGARCAFEERLWASPLQALERAHMTHTGNATQCPVPATATTEQSIAPAALSR
jgi:hypothetical protein